MILNEAVTLLGYKVDERGLQKYQRQIENQRKEALKLLATHQKAEAAKVKAAENTAKANERLGQRLQRNAERQLAQEIRNASRITAAKEREAAKQLRAQELAYNRQVAANARALAAMDRANERHLNTQIRQAQRASAAQARAAVAAAKATERERAKSSAFLRGGIGGMGLGMMGLGAGALSVGGAVAGAKSVYDTGVEREAMQIGLQNLPGMDKISAMGKFRELRNINASKAFGIEEAVKGFIRLKDMGLDASATALNAYAGIAASKPGKSMMDFVEAVADGVMGESERLKEFGIKMRVDGDKAAITFRNQTVKVNRDAKSIEKALMDIGIKNYSKALSDAANSTAAKTRNMENSFKELKYQVWEGGLKSAFHNLIDGTTDLLKKWTPLAREFAIFSRLNLKRTLSATAEGLKLVAGAIGVLMLKTVGDAYITMIANIGKMSTALKTLGWSAFYAQSGLSAIVKGGAIVTLALILADFVYYLNTGDSKLVQFTERWPALSRAIKDGYYWNKVFIEAVTIGFSKIWIKINDVYQKTKLWFDHIKNEIANPLVLKFLAAMAGGNPIVGGVVNLLGGGSPSTGPNAGSQSAALGNIGMTARNFAKGGVGLSDADMWAKSGASMSGFKVNQLFIEGNACAISTEKVVADAGGSKALLDKMNASVPQTKKALETSGMVDVVPFDQLQGGELFYQWSDKYNDWGHTGVVGPGGKTLIHASTEAGRQTRGQLGLKQRYKETPNYLGGNGIYMRIKPEFMNQMPAPNQGGAFKTSSASVQLNQNFYGQTDPRKAGSAAQTGVQSGLNRVQIGLPTYTNGIA